jgi:hypothetical protein
MKRMLERIFGWYIRRVRGTLDHAVFGRLEMTYCNPRIRMYWWQSRKVFPPVAHPITLELHCPPSGPNQRQVLAYQRLLMEYATLLERGAGHGDLPSNARPKLVKITLFIHGHIDLHFRDGNLERKIYADQNASYLTPEVAAAN